MGFGTAAFGSGGSEAPLVQYSPASGETIAKDGAVTVYAIDDSGLLAVVSIVAKYADGTWEAVYHGNKFAPYFSGSSRAAIAGGVEYTIRRRGGWKSSPTLSTVLADAEGNREV